MKKRNACGSINHVYFLCLIDWGRVLGFKELKEITQKIMKLSERHDGWTIKTLKWPDVADIVSDVELGFYHSRMIFKFGLKSTPKDIFQIRDQRERLESSIETFCSEEVIPVIKSHNKDAEKPFIFTYPIFELNRLEHFWRFKKQKPYSLSTTCFFTELKDPKGFPLLGRNVKMRISGAKTIASDMSKWFFENLVSIIFHEGLYRQTRDKKLGKLHSEEEVYKGLENRLEDFASRLMTTFHEYSSEHVRRNIQWIALIVSGTAILIGILNLIK